MIQLFGQISLGLTLICAILQISLPSYGLYRNNIYLLASSRSLCFLQFTFILLAYFFLTLAFVTNDFSIAYVAANSHETLPLVYRVTAVWGAHEGSILLWIVILNAWSALFAILHRNDINITLVLIILAVISVCFLMFIIFTSNPFITAIVPMGRDLNPLLQDPGFVSHPPMLYIGYVGASIPFALTMASLLQKNLNYRWAELTRLYTLATWCFLTLGITLGSWWAYRVLGWGGFWFWDPVENASLLPWLLDIALIHILVLVEKRNSAKMWSCLLAIFVFATSVLGTFLVRSGVLISAHTFAQDPTRGSFLLILLAIFANASFFIFIKRLSLFSKNTLPVHFFSRDLALMLNNVLMVTAFATILVGILYPLLLDVFHLGNISVGAPYFNIVLLPIVFLTLIMMSFAGFLTWHEKSFLQLLGQYYKNFLVSFGIALLLCFLLLPDFQLLTFLGLLFSICILVNLINVSRMQRAMTIAHAGFAILIIGILLSSTLSLEREVRMRVGAAVHLGPYQFFFLSEENISAGNFRGIRAAFEVLKGNKHIVNLYPEKRWYKVRDMVMTNVAIHPSIFRDLYIALGQPLDRTDWSVRIYYKPFMRWIWAGGTLMILGGCLTLMQRKAWKK